MALKEDYKDAVFSGLRKYKTVENDDGTVSLADVTEYAEKGDKFGAKDLNEITKKINSTDEGLTNQGKKIEDLTTNMSGLTFGQDANGKWGYRVGGADPVIPFNTGDKLKESRVVNGNTIPSERFFVELVSYVQDFYFSSPSYVISGADLEKAIYFKGFQICKSGYSNVGGNMAVAQLILKGTPGNIFSVAATYQSYRDRANMSSLITTVIPLMEE